MNTAKAFTTSNRQNTTAENRSPNYTKAFDKIGYTVTPVKK